MYRDVGVGQCPRCDEERVWLDDERVWLDDERERLDDERGEPRSR